MCIIPLSIETAVFNLEAKAVTKAGHANLDLSSEILQMELGF